MLIRNIEKTNHEPVAMEGTQGLTMSVMVGQSDNAPNFAMRHILVEPGGHSPRHSHDYEHEVYIVKGKGTVLLQGKDQPIRTGDVVYVPADHEHQFRAGDQGLSFLCLVPVTRNCGSCTPGS